MKDYIVLKTKGSTSPASPLDIEGSFLKSFSVAAWVDSKHGVGVSKDQRATHCGSFSGGTIAPSRMWIMRSPTFAASGFGVVMSTVCSNFGFVLRSIFKR